MAQNDPKTSPKSKKIKNPRKKFSLYGVIQILRNALGGGRGSRILLRFVTLIGGGGEGPNNHLLRNSYKFQNVLISNNIIFSSFISLALVLFQETTYSSILTFLKIPYLSIQITFSSALSESYRRLNFGEI